jgi:hypothetical protein
MKQVGIFYGYLDYFTAVLYILWLFGIFFGLFGIFFLFWYVVSRKSGNPATDRISFSVLRMGKV